MMRGLWLPAIATALAAAAADTVPPLSPLLLYSAAEQGTFDRDPSSARRERERQPQVVLHVECSPAASGTTGSSTRPADGTPARPFRTVQAAVDHAAALAAAGNATAVAVEISEGICFMDRPLQITAKKTASTGSEPEPELELRGRGPRSVLSGGREVSGWSSVEWPGAPPGAVWAADVRGWPVEIKTLRHGPALVPRSRWPRLVGEGLSTPNWLFAQPWSTHPPADGDARQLHGLGVASAALPHHGNASLAGLVGAYAHVLGCVGAQAEWDGFFWQSSRHGTLRELLGYQ